MKTERGFFKVGDLVKLIDEDGDEGLGIIGDLGIVKSSYLRGLTKVEFITGKSKGKSTNRYWHRFELAEQEWDR